MDHQAEHDPSHRRGREHMKGGRKKFEEGVYLNILHPAWYVVAAVITCGLAVILWTCLPW